MLAPAHALFEPEQRHLCFFELAGGGALEVEDRDRHLETLRPARVRQREADALGTFADTVAHPPATNSDRTDAGHDLTLRQVAVAHQTSAAIVDYLVGVSLEQSRYLGFDRLPEQPRAPLRNTSVSGSAKVPGWGNCKTLVSVWRIDREWRRRIHGTPPHPFMRSPTFEYNSFPSVSHPFCNTSASFLRRPFLSNTPCIGSRSTVLSTASHRYTQSCRIKACTTLVRRILSCRSGSPSRSLITISISYES